MPNSGKKIVNLKLVIEYDGKNYFGWQRQSAKSKNQTIQQVIEKSLQVLFKTEKIVLTGAGRTDSGVHAVNQCANFKVNAESMAKYSGEKGMNKLLYSLNAILPPDIVVKKISETRSNFHARYDAKERVYQYFITTQKHALGADKLFHIRTKFDIDLANEFCKLLQGYRSFKSLCKNPTDEHGFMCNLRYARVKKLKEGIIRFEICASRFLHSMVRAITGAMIDVASGKMKMNIFLQKFNKGEKIKTQYVPANALFLVNVKY